QPRVALEADGARAGGLGVALAEGELGAQEAAAVDHRLFALALAAGRLAVLREEGHLDVPVADELLQELLPAAGPGPGLVGRLWVLVLLGVLRRLLRIGRADHADGREDNDEQAGSRTGHRRSPQWAARVGMRPLRPTLQGDTARGAAVGLSVTAYRSG